MKQQTQINKIEWREVELGELVSKEINYPIGDGDHGQIKPSMYKNQGIPYIRVGDMVADRICLDKIVYISEKVHNDNLKSELLPGDVLIAKTGATIGKVAVVPKSIQKANTTSSVGKITPDKNKILPEYLLYFIKTREFIKQMWLVSNKSAQPGFNIVNLKKFKIPLPFSEGKPDLKEQKRIVSILEKAETLKQKGKIAENLFDEYLKSVFWEMFDNRRFEKTPIWKLCDVISGSTPSTSKEEYWNGNIDWVTPAELIDGDNYYYYESKRKITEKGLQAISGRLFSKETVMLTTRAPIGKVAIAGKEMCTNQGFKNMICKDELNPIYLYFWLLSNKDYLNSLGVGATFKEISKKIVEQIKIPLPPLPLQQKFARIVEQVEKMKENVKKTQKNSEELFNSLMQKAFRGMLI